MILENFQMRFCHIVSMTTGTEINNSEQLLGSCKWVLELRIEDYFYASRSAYA